MKYRVRVREEAVAEYIIEASGEDEAKACALEVFETADANSDVEHDIDLCKALPDGDTSEVDWTWEAS